MSEEPHANQGFKDTSLEQYTLYVEDVQKLGSRHEHSRKYYLTLISALFTVLSLGTTGLGFVLTPAVVKLVAGFGVCLCLLWALHMRSYSVLFRTKFKILGRMEEEKHLSFPVFKEETALLFKPGSGYVSITRIDFAVAFIFIVLFGLLPFLTLPQK